MTEIIKAKSIVKIIASKNCKEFENAEKKGGKSIGTIIEENKIKKVEDSGDADIAKKTEDSD